MKRVMARTVPLDLAYPGGVRAISETWFRIPVSAHGPYGRSAAAIEGIAAGGAGRGPTRGAVAGAGAAGSCVPLRPVVAVSGADAVCGRAPGRATAVVVRGSAGAVSGRASAVVTVVATSAEAMWGMPITSGCGSGRLSAGALCAHPVPESVRALVRLRRTGDRKGVDAEADVARHAGIAGCATGHTDR